MISNSGDPVAAISEAEAIGEISALYDDIRTTLGVPVVNLIWRHLAVFPGALPWAWQALKPLYASGAITAQAEALRAGLDVPALPGLSRPVLAAAGLSAEDLARIDMIQRSYERSNAMNIIALGALHAHLIGSLEGRAEPTPLPAAPPTKAENTVTGEMPVLMTLEQMSPELRTLVEDLNRIGGRDEILASMYRHLAHWPVYLALFHTLIAPFAADGRLESLITGVIADGHRRATTLAAQIVPLDTTLPGDVQASICSAVAQFINEPIGKMITIVPLIRRALPNKP